MRMRTIEISVGGFVLAGFIALVFLALQVSGVTRNQATESYEVTARFDDVECAFSRCNGRTCCRHYSRRCK